MGKSLSQLREEVSELSRIVHLQQQAEESAATRHQWQNEEAAHVAALAAAETVALITEKIRHTLSAVPTVSASAPSAYKPAQNALFQRQLLSCVVGNDDANRGFKPATSSTCTNPLQVIPTPPSTRRLTPNRTLSEVPRKASSPAAVSACAQRSGCVVPKVASITNLSHANAQGQLPLWSRPLPDLLERPAMIDSPPQTRGASLSPVSFRRRCTAVLGPHSPPRRTSPSGAARPHSRNLVQAHSLSQRSLQSAHRPARIPMH